jgi:hypothetical protein
MNKFYKCTKDDFLKSVGLFYPNKRKFHVINEQSKPCDICFKDEIGEDGINSNSNCGHNFFGFCMNQYLGGELGHFEFKSSITCAGYECNWIIEVSKGTKRSK